MLHNNGTNNKWLMLVFVSFLTFGSYWCYDLPGALQSQLKDEFGDNEMSNARIGLLYSIYAWPNTILAFFGGFIIDRITGVPYGAVLFSTFATIGQFMFALGVELKLYWLCFAGRLFSGIGGVSLCVSQNAYIARWFSGDNYITFAFSITVAVSRLGSSINFAVSSSLAERGVSFAVWFGSSFVLLSLLISIIAWLFDKSKKKPTIESQDQTKLQFSHIREIPLNAWILCLIYTFFYIAVVIFFQVASDILINTGHRYDKETAPKFLAIPMFVSIFAVPMFGKLVDSQGRALTCITIGSLMLATGHFSFLGLACEWYDVNLIPIMIWLGIGYSLGASSIRTIVSLIVTDKRLTATIYGCMASVQNIGLAIVPLIIGKLQENEDIKYTIPIILFIGSALITVLLTLYLRTRDPTLDNPKQTQLE